MWVTYTLLFRPVLFQTHETEYRKGSRWYTTINSIDKINRSTALLICNGFFCAVAVLQYLTTLIPYNPKTVPPNIEYLQIYVKSNTAQFLANFFYRIIRDKCCEIDLDKPREMCTVQQKNNMNIKVSTNKLHTFDMYCRCFIVNVWYIRISKRCISVFVHLIFC